MRDLPAYLFMIFVMVLAMYHKELRCHLGNEITCAEIRLPAAGR